MAQSRQDALGQNRSIAPSEDLHTKRLFTTGEVAKICGVSQHTIIRCFDSGKLGGFRVPGSKFRRIPRGELIMFMRENNMSTNVLECDGHRIILLGLAEKLIDDFMNFFAHAANFAISWAQTDFETGMMVERQRPHVLIIGGAGRSPENIKRICQSVCERSPGTKLLLVSSLDSRQRRASGIAGVSSIIALPCEAVTLKNRVLGLLGIEE